MPITGDFAAYDYRLPDDQPKQNLQQGYGSGASQGASGFNMPAPPSDLEEVDGRTGNFYKKYTDMYGFANAMKKTYNIDVTAPDISNPESVKAHQIFLKMYADVKHEGDQLHQAKKRADYMSQGLAEGKLLADNNYLSNQQGNRITSAQEMNAGIGSNKISDIVEGANKVMKHYYDQGAFDKVEEHRKGVLSYLTQQMQDAVESGQFGKAKEYDQNIKALQAPSVGEDPNLALKKRALDQQADYNRRRLALQAQKLQDKKEVSSPVSILVKDIGNILDGNPESFRQSSRTTPDGNAYMEAPYPGISLAGKDKKTGKTIQKPLESFLLDPKTGAMVALFKDGTKEPVDRSTKDAFQLLQNISSSTGAGRTFPMKEIQAYAKDQGLLKSSGGINYQTNKNPEAERAMQANEANRSSSFQELFKDLTYHLNSLSKGAFRKPMVVYDGKTPILNIYKQNKMGSDKFFVENGDGTTVKEGLDTKALRDYLVNEGYASKIVNGELDIHSLEGSKFNPAVSHKIQSNYTLDGGQEGVPVEPQKPAEPTTDKAPEDQMPVEDAWAQ